MRIEAGLLLTYAKVTGGGLRLTSGSGGVREKQSRLEMGVSSAITTATGSFGPPAARSTTGMNPVRISARLPILKAVE